MLNLSFSPGTTAFVSRKNALMSRVAVAETDSSVIHIVSPSSTPAILKTLKIHVAPVTRWRHLSTAQTLSSPETVEVCLNTGMPIRSRDRIVRPRNSFRSSTRVRRIFLTWPRQNLHLDRSAGVPTVSPLSCLPRTISTVCLISVRVS